MTKQQEIQNERKLMYFTAHIKDEMKKFDMSDKQKEAVTELLIYAYNRGRQLK